ncbi:trypsin-like serine protease [Basidiobolus meristosporus CBS 931.73]|uniref:Trypsin-like serine protease n=1 Tax=Basidiobolus meristosporus CBS 931.73 TaxID=1314790 RepID=A0A1Y1XRG6_9FUNG|nr:trypsin-like serine protease [Basidiobolus meristosporus CBS 931.73]|eukprot:ORX88323.1 trypsin-like serine protease [Basidiobolus meristosporus CBS 931.73]
MDPQRLLIFLLCGQLTLSIPTGITRPKYLIYGGTTVESSRSYPWMAFTYLRNPATGDMRWCGGAVLDSTTILSAAHCFHERPPGDVMVHLLRQDLRKQAEDEGGAVIRAVNVSIHPGWDRERAVNDFAILKLAEATPPAVKSIAFHRMDRPIKNQHRVKALGWGLVAPTEYPDLLQEIDMQVFDDDVCVQKYTALDMPFDPAAVLCVGNNTAGKNVCSGDSGGPLVSYGADESPCLIGITSYSAGCDLDVPAAFARVSSQEDWIKSHLTPSFF